MKKFIPNPAIHPNGPGDVMYVAANTFAQIRDFVDEGYFRGEKGVGCILSQLSSLKRRHDERNFNQIERAIKVTHDRNCLVITASNNHSIGPHEIINGGALAEEF